MREETTPFHVYFAMRDKSREPANEFEQALYDAVHETGAPVSPAVSRALDIFRSKAMHFMNAALFAYKADISEIANCFDVDVEVVEAYKKLFFDTAVISGLDRRKDFMLHLAKENPGMAALFEDVTQFGLERIKYLLQPGFSYDEEWRVYDQLAYSAISRLREFEFQRITHPQMRMNKELLEDRKFVSDWAKKKADLKAKTARSSGIEHLHIQLLEISDTTSVSDLSDEGIEVHQA